MKRLASCALWASPGYRPWLTYTVMEAYAGAITSFAITLIAYDLSGSATAAGALGTVRLVIAYGLMLFGGIVVDSYDRRPLMFIRAAASLLLWGSVAVLALTGALTFTIFAALACASMAVSGLVGAAGESALRSLVSGQTYVEARSVNEARDASSQIIGSPVAGFLYAILPALPFIVSAVGQLVAVVTTWFLPPLPPKTTTETDSQTPKEPFILRVMAGYRWLAKSRQMLALTAFGLVINVGMALLMTGVTLLLLSCGVDSAIIGLVVMGEAVGVVIGSIFAPRLTKKIPTGRLLLLTNVAAIVFLTPLVISQNLVLITVCYFLWGLTIPAANASLGGYMFQLVPIDIQGRVISANALLVGIPLAFSSLAAGSLVDAGWGVWTIGGGLVSAVLALAILLLERSLLDIPVPEDWPSEVPC